MDASQQGHLQQQQQQQQQQAFLATPLPLMMPSSSSSFERQPLEHAQGTVLVKQEEEETVHRLPLPPSTPSGALSEVMRDVQERQGQMHMQQHIKEEADHRAAMRQRFLRQDPAFNTDTGVQVQPPVTSLPAHLQGNGVAFCSEQFAREMKLMQQHQVPSSTFARVRDVSEHSTSSTDEGEGGSGSDSTPRVRPGAASSFSSPSTSSALSNVKREGALHHQQQRGRGEEHAANATFHAMQIVSDVDDSAAVVNMSLNSSAESSSNQNAGWNAKHQQDLLQRHLHSAGADSRPPSDEFLDEESPASAMSSSLSGSGGVPASPLKTSAAHQQHSSSSSLPPASLSTVLPLSPESLAIAAAGGGIGASLLGGMQPRTKRGQGVSCHSCKTSKDTNSLFHCQNKGEKNIKKRRCRKKYCEICLKRSYPSCLPADAAAIAVWQCPSCLMQCLCASCQRRDAEKALQAQQATATSPKGAASAAAAGPTTKGSSPSNGALQSPSSKSKQQQAQGQRNGAGAGGAGAGMSFSMPSSRSHTPHTSVKTDPAHFHQPLSPQQCSQQQVHQVQQQHHSPHGVPGLEHYGGTNMGIGFLGARPPMHMEDFEAGGIGGAHHPHPVGAGGAHVDEVLFGSGGMEYTDPNSRVHASNSSFMGPGHTPTQHTQLHHQSPSQRVLSSSAAGSPSLSGQKRKMGRHSRDPSPLPPAALVTLSRNSSGSTRFANTDERSMQQQQLQQQQLIFDAANVPLQTFASLTATVPLPQSHTRQTRAASAHERRHSVSSALSEFTTHADAASHAVWAAQATQTHHQHYQLQNQMAQQLAQGHMQLHQAASLIPGAASRCSSYSSISMLQPSSVSQGDSGFSTPVSYGPGQPVQHHGYSHSHSQSHTPPHVRIPSHSGVGGGGHGQVMSTPHGRSGSAMLSPSSTSRFLHQGGADVSLHELSRGSSHASSTPVGSSTPASPFRMLTLSNGSPSGNASSSDFTSPPSVNTAPLSLSSTTTSTSLSSARDRERAAGAFSPLSMTTSPIAHGADGQYAQLQQHEESGAATMEQSGTSGQQQRYSKMRAQLQQPKSLNSPPLSGSTGTAPSGYRSLNMSTSAAAGSNSPGQAQGLAEADRMRVLQQQQMEWMRLQQQIRKKQQEVYREQQLLQMQQQQRQGDRATPEHQRQLENPELRTPPRKLQRADLSNVPATSLRNALIGLGTTQGSFLSGGSNRRRVPMHPLGLQPVALAAPLSDSHAHRVLQSHHHERRFSESMIDETTQAFLMEQEVVGSGAYIVDPSLPHSPVEQDAVLTMRPSRAAAAARHLMLDGVATLPDAPASVAMQRHQSEPAGGASRVNSRDNSVDNTARCDYSARDEHEPRAGSPPPARALDLPAAAAAGQSLLVSPQPVVSQPSRLRSWSEPVAPSADLVLLMSSMHASQQCAAGASAQHEGSTAGLAQVDEGMDAEEGVSVELRPLSAVAQPNNRNDALPSQHRQSPQSRVLPASILVPDSGRSLLHPQQGAASLLFTPLPSSSPLATLFTPSPMPSMSPPDHTHASILPHSTTPPVSVSVTGSSSSSSASSGNLSLSINVHASSVGHPSSFAVLSASPSAFMAPFSPMPLQLGAVVPGMAGSTTNHGGLSASAAPSPGFTLMFPSSHVGLPSAGAAVTSFMSTPHHPLPSSSPHGLDSLRVPGPGLLFPSGSPQGSPLPPLDATEMIKPMEFV